jgi:hypothetical protein
MDSDLSVGIDVMNDKLTENSSQWDSKFQALEQKIANQIQMYNKELLGLIQQHADKLNQEREKRLNVELRMEENKKILDDKVSFWRQIVLEILSQPCSC